MIASHNCLTQLTLSLLPCARLPEVKLCDLLTK